MPWSKTPKSGFQSKSSTLGTHQALDDLRPARERTIRTTTVTGGRGSSSDEENFLDTGLPEDRWETGIRKGVTTTVTTEVSAGNSKEESEKKSKRRSFSLGKDSYSTLDDDERRKPMGSFNPFQ
jgi:hypothetical protein